MPEHLTINDIDVAAVVARTEYQHAAIADVVETTNLPTFTISLGLLSPTKAGIEAEINALKATDNEIKGVLRGAGLMVS